MKTGIFITVRTGSSRLPKKALKEVKQRPVISYLIERLKTEFNGKLPIIICTTTLKEDYVLDGIAKEYGIDCYHGDPENIIRRHYECAVQHCLDFILNIDGDDILCDPGYASKVAESACTASGYDVIKTSGLPFGMNSMGYKTEVIANILKGYDSKKLDTGWGAMITDKTRFKILEIAAEPDDTLEVRLSLDYEEDFLLFKEIIERLFEKDKRVSHREIIEFLKNNPELIKINAHLNEEYWRNYYSKKAEEGR